MNRLLQFAFALSAAVVFFAAPHPAIADDHKSMLLSQ